MTDSDYTVILLPCRDGFPNKWLNKALLKHDIPTIPLHRGDKLHSEKHLQEFLNINRYTMYVLAAWSQGGTLAINLAHMPNVAGVILQAPVHPSCAYPSFTAPGIILHNKNDTVVPYRNSVILKRENPSLRLVGYSGSDNHFASEHVQKAVDFVQDLFVQSSVKISCKSCTFDNHISRVACEICLKFL